MSAWFRSFPAKNGTKTFEMSFAHLEGSRLKGFRRFAVITRVMLKHGLGDVVERLFTRAAKKEKGIEDKGHRFKAGFPSPKRIRLVLEELGPSFIKLGQLMSTRADMFPPEYLEEFRKLQDQVPPVPFEDIKKVIQDELKRPLSEIFKEFNPEPIAAASVAQVHLAELPTGEKLAVKVIRPGIDKKIRQDIQLMYYLAGKIEKSFEIGRILGTTNLVGEFERTIFRELDMFVEGGSIERFSRNFKDSQDIYIPKVYWDYTSRSVLSMEHIEGIKMDQVEAIKAHGIDPKKIAELGLRSFSRQLMEFGFFHADPHPGNTIVMYDGRVALVDFGITGYLDEQTMLEIANVFLGYAEHDYDMILDALLDAGIIDEKTMDLKSFQIDLKDISEPFYGRSLQTISVRDVYDQVMRLVYKYHIRMPQNILLLLKTFIQTEALGKILGSDASILEATSPYAKKLLKRGYDTKKLFRHMGKDVRLMGGYMRTMPKFVHDILKQTAQGKQRLELWHDGFRNLDAQFAKGISRLTVGLVVSASLIAAAMVLNSSQTVFEVTVNVFGLKTISITHLFGLMGYLIATILGIWLIVSIFRSGRH
jgi:ubiquinone biosynthesis protein